jgi:uncharacterized membrane-anchored protein
MRPFTICAYVVALAAISPAFAEAPSSAEPSADVKATIAKYEALPWVNAPSKPPISARAAIALDVKTRFLDPKGTNSLLKLTGNLPEDNSYVVAAKSRNWFAVYAFDEMGYVKDDEKIDADALLKSLRESQEASNSTRKEQGLDPLTVVGWAVPPHYDAATHNLEYGVTLGSPSGNNINYHLRMLGRRGVMDATLITSPEYLKDDLAEFRVANKGFAYGSGEDYASYKDGDKVSQYGLAALVTGGAAAALVKTGLFGGLLKGLLVFWKIIAVGFIAFFASIRKFIVRLFGKGDKLGPPSGE